MKRGKKKAWFYSMPFLIIVGLMIVVPLIVYRRNILYQYEYLSLEGLSFCWTGQLQKGIAGF